MLTIYAAVVDVGCAQLIIDEKVTLKSGAEVSSFTPDGVVFSDGSSLACDVVIFACVKSRSSDSDESDVL